MEEVTAKLWGDGQNKWNSKELQKNKHAPNTRGWFQISALNAQYRDWRWEKWEGVERVFDVFFRVFSPLFQREIDSKYLSVKVSKLDI